MRSSPTIMIVLLLGSSRPKAKGLTLGAGLLFLAGGKFLNRLKKGDADPSPVGWFPPRP
ncbi:hypothetical protein ACX80E_13365 [Arthrobacter sp. TMN-49]